MIWECRSSLNIRNQKQCIQNKSEKLIWNNIKNDIDTISINIIIALFL